MFKGIKKSICKLLAGVTALSLVFAVEAPTKVLAASDVTVNLSSTKQVIRGFGGMNHPIWAGDLTESQRVTAFGNNENQLGFSILRIHVDENKNNWSKELATAKSAIAHGAIVFASPWNPPSSMIETFTRNGVANQKRLKYDQYDEYAAYLNEFVTYMKNNGVNLYAISVQNEPDYAHDWTWWTPTEMLTFMKNNAGSINCKVIAPESFQYLKNMSDPILNDAQALANMDILGAHFYGTSISNMSYPLFQQKGAGKDLWMTEVYVPNSDANSADRWPEAIDVSYNMHNAMVEGNFQAYVWWYIRRQYGPMKEDGAISKRGACMAQYSKFVRPGYVRIDATKNPNTNIYISAFKGDNKVVIVAINRGTTDVSQNFILQNASGVTSMNRWRTSANETVQKTTSVDVTNGSFWAFLPAQSVSTFVSDSSAVIPTVAPTVTPTVKPTVTPTVAPTMTPTVTPTSTTAKPVVTVNTTNNGNSINQSYKVTAQGGTIDLSKLKIVFTADGMSTAEQSVFIDSAALQLNVSPWYSSIISDVTGSISNKTLTIAVNNNTQLAVGEGSLIIELRFAKTDWSTYGTLSNPVVNVYYNGTLIK